MWSEQIDSLDKSNHTFLANNKKLVQQINSTGEKSGTVGFVTAHLFAVAPVVLICYADLTHRRRPHAFTMPPPQSRPDGAEFIDVPPWNTLPTFTADDDRTRLRR
jgi:hypothetical protein